MLNKVSISYCLRCASVVFCWILVCAAPVFGAGSEQPLTFDERVECQRALEQVLWQFRIWPEGNPGAKPDLSEVLPEEVLRRKVDDVLRLSTALADRWQRPITPTDLQAELDRIGANTAAPDMLHEMLLALGYDARLAAECLARPLVAERLARQAFAVDEAVHGPGRAVASQDLERIVAEGIQVPVRGAVTETEWVRYGMKKAKFEVMNERSEVARLYLSAAQWDGLVGGVDAVAADAPDDGMAPLQEADDRWWSISVSEAKDGYRRLVRVVWPKTDFDEWWQAARAGFEPGTVKPFAGYSIGLFGESTAKVNNWYTTAIDALTPAARELHTAVWTGSEMLIFGGQGTVGTMWSGGRYSPATDNWTAMMNAGSTVGSRADHTAVWSGSRMIVWGGWSNGELSTGGLYNPTTNTWGTTTATNAPSARRYHAACWTNGYMVVWGGWSGSAYIGTGAKYTSGSWVTLPTSTSGVSDPSSRSDHTAAYVGGSQPYVMIWGGHDAAGPLNNGRRLQTNFVPPRWHTLTTTDDPPARYDHTAVVIGGTGSNVADRRVIIWGGTSNGTTGLLSGGAYNTALDEWEPVTPSGAASSRFGHTAVWADYTMIVWGGESGGVSLRSGGVFNYFNQDWNVTTQTGAPTARTAHVAAYRPTSSNTGTMVVWGGDDGTPADTGGRYIPPTDFIVRVSDREIKTVSNATLYNDNQASAISLNSFTGAVTLSQGGSAPLAVYFADNTLSPPASSSVSTLVTYSVTTSGTGTWPFEIVGTSGGETRRYGMTLIVQDYDIACSPSPISASPGEDATTTCTVSSIAGFSSNVDLYCTNFTCTFDPNPVDPPAGGVITSELTVHVGAAQAPGNYQVEVVAARDGTSRVFYLGLEVVDADLIFTDGFESGDTTAWSDSVG